MVVDIGGGTADIAVISLGGVVESASIKVGRRRSSDEAVVKYIRKKHNVLIGDRTAEELKMTIGCVFPRPEEVTMEIKGRCLMTGLPRVFSVTSSEMIEAFEEPCRPNPGGHPLGAGAHAARAGGRHRHQRHCHDRRRQPGLGL